MPPVTCRAAVRYSNLGEIVGDAVWIVQPYRCKRKALQCQEAQLIRNLQSLRALAFALITHAAIERPDLLVAHENHLFVFRSIRFRHRPEVHFELGNRLHEGNGGSNGWILKDPLDAGQRTFPGRVRLFPRPERRQQPEHRP